MSTLVVEVQAVKAQKVVVTDDTLAVDLSDGRTVARKTSRRLQNLREVRASSDQRHAERAEQLALE